MSTENTPTQSASNIWSRDSRIEVRVDGKLLIGLSAKKAPESPEEFMGLLAEILNSPNVPDTDLV